MGRVKASGKKPIDAAKVFMTEKEGRDWFDCWAPGSRKRGTVSSGGHPTVVVTAGPTFTQYRSPNGVTFVDMQWSFTHAGINCGDHKANTERWEREASERFKKQHRYDVVTQDARYNFDGRYVYTDRPDGRTPDYFPPQSVR